MGARDCFVCMGVIAVYTCVCVRACSRAYATMKRMCQIDDWQVAQATLVSKVHKKMRKKKAALTVPSVVHCHPDRKKCACTGVGCSCVRACV